MAPEIISRNDARARGLKHYFTGIVCPHGHLRLRLVSNKLCLGCVLIYNRRWRERHPERSFNIRKQCNIRHRQKHPERHRAQVKNWGEKNPEIKRTLKRRYKARKRGALGSHTEAESAELLVLQRNRCAYCRKLFGKHRKPTLDHIIAIVNGGTDNKNNLQWLCGFCSSSKRDKDPIDYIRRAGRLI